MKFRVILHNVEKHTKQYQENWIKATAA